VSVALLTLLDRSCPALWPFERFDGLLANPQAPVLVFLRAESRRGSGSFPLSFNGPRRATLDSTGAVRPRELNGHYRNFWAYPIEKKRLEAKLPYTIPEYG